MAALHILHPFGALIVHILKNTLLHMDAGYTRQRVSSWSHTKYAAMNVKNSVHNAAGCLREHECMVFL